jgi:hypothetical protein
MTNVFSSEFQNQVIGVLKGIGVFGEDKGFHFVTHPSPSLQASLRLWYNLHSYVLFAKGEKVIRKRALMIPFLAIYAKGGESMSPKQKDRTTTNLKSWLVLILERVFQLV